MPNEISLEASDELVRCGLKHKIYGFIFSNLIKDRANPAFDRSEIESVRGFIGNFPAGRLLKTPTA